MKRPLLAVCALVVCLTILWQALFPPDLPEHAWSGERVYLYGRVVGKEHKTASGQEKSILYLSDIILFSDLPQEFGGEISTNQLSSALTEYGVTSVMAEDKQVMIYLSENLLGDSSESVGDAGTVREPLMGQYVLIEGVLADFDRPRNPGEFDSRLYYAGLGVRMQMFQGEPVWYGREYDRFLEGMWQLKYRWTKILVARLGQKNGSILATILLGSKEVLDGEMKTLYQLSGISHILAISGLHISLVGMGIYSIVRRIGLPTWVAALVGILGVILFGIFTDAGASAYRAAGMFVIRMLGTVLRRNYDMLTSLGVLLVLMVLQNPLCLYQMGLQLSFGAMIGIGCIYPLLLGEEKTHIYREGVAKRIYKFRQGIKKSLILSFSVMVVTFPVMSLTFYEIAPYSLVLNLLILPFLPCLFVLGILLIVVWRWEISTIFCILTNSVLNGYAWMAQQSLRLPGSRLIVGGVHAYQVLFYLMVLGILILWGKRISRQGCWKLVFIAILSMTVRVNFRTEICFLDVGQGDGIFVQTDAGDCYLIDGGSSSEKEIGKYTIAPFLKSKGVREIDAWIITHPDADHCNGLADTLEAGYGKRVKRILLPSAMDASRGGNENATENETGNGAEDKTENAEYQEILELAEKYNIPVYFLSAGMQWQEDDARFLCLNPPPLTQITPITASQTNAQMFSKAAELSANEYSLVFYLELGKRSFLLTGDVEKSGEKYLIAELQKRGITHVDVLKVAHHGSRYSTTEAFLDVLDADVAVISCGENNVYGHPHRETLERLKKEGCVVWNIAEKGWFKIE